LDQRDISVYLFALFIVIEIEIFRKFENISRPYNFAFVARWQNFDNLKNCNLKSPTDGSVQNVSKFAT